MLLSRSLTLAVPLAVLACALLAGGCDRQSGDAAQPRADVASKPLPAMTLHDARGNTLELGSLKGKPVLLNLWATWCAPCIAELPTLNALAGRQAGKLRVLTVSQDTQMTEKVAPFLKERGLDRLEPWLDPDSDLTFALGVEMLPTTILYDAQGREVWRYAGDRDWTSEDSAGLLAKAMEK